MSAAPGISDPRKTPFPWFGGKRHAAPHVWAALGDVDHYCEPFFGGGAVLLHRPHPANRTYISETVNDADGLLVNFWRAVQADPASVALHACWPVSEADKHARGCALIAWRDAEQPAHLAGDPGFFDVRMAGWWAWVVCCQIGGWGLGGPWWPDASGRLRRRGKGDGVRGGIVALSDDGRGVNHAGLREPGIVANRPHLSNDGQCVNAPQLREPGTDYHGIVMPALVDWLGYLSARLRHVRILQGDWTRLTTNGALKTLSVRTGGVAGVFLDPPYAEDIRADIYAYDSTGIAGKVRDWCLDRGDDPQLRIVLAGFDTEHTELVDAGWRCVEWFKAGHLRGGMGQQGKDGHQQHRERLWLSPHCLQPEPDAQLGLFDMEPVS